MKPTQQLVPAQIKEQVVKILKTKEFRNSKLLTDFLKYIVKETLAGSEQSLKEYVIATEVLKKSSDFNPQLDAVVRIHARRLRKLLENYYLEEGINDPVKISVPKGRYIPHFEQNNSDSGYSRTDHNLDDQDIETLPTIAVLPFECFEDRERGSVICSVLSQDITVALSHFKELKVISDHSSRYAKEHIDRWDEIVSHLGVNYIITGGCISEKDNLRVSVELHSAEEDQLLWAETMIIENFKQNELRNYGKIVKKVIASVCGYFGVIYQNTMNNHIPQDFDTLYAIYWHNKFHQQFSIEGFEEATQAVEKALEINPDNSLLLALKAEFYLNLCAMDLEGDTNCFEIGSNLVQKAVALDTKNQHAWQVYSWARILDKNIVDYDKGVEKMLSINPFNPMYMATVGFGHQCVGKYEEGLELMLESIDLNPYCHWVVNFGMTMYYFHKKEYQEALYWARLINRPNLLWDPLYRSAALGLLGREKEAAQAVEELFVLSPNFSERATYIIGRFTWDKELQSTLLEGLKKAGIDIVQPS